MIENIRNLVFSGAAFPSTALRFFPAEKDRMCLVYGRNGSGKSTISKAVLKIDGNDIPEISTAYFANENGNAIAVPTEDGQKRIFVFNEDYVQQKVRLKDDGLSTIVMFGKQAEIEALIENAQIAYTAAESDLETYNSTFSQYTDMSSVQAPNYYIMKMNLALSGDKNWAGRERIITGGRRNASVSNTTYLTIVENIPANSQEVIQREYDHKFALLTAARSGNAKIEIEIKHDYTVPDIEERVISLLAEVIEKPVLSEREKYILSLIENGKSDQVAQMQLVFAEPSTDVCPFCLQEVTGDYRQKLSESIQHVLSKIVDEHKTKLNSCMLTEIAIDFSPFGKLDSSLISNCQLALDAVNACIQSINTALSSKYLNPYAPVFLNKVNLQIRLSELNEKLLLLEEARNAYNAPLSDIPSLQKKLQELNLQLAYFEIKDFYETFLKQSQLKAEAEKKREQKQKEALEKKRILDELQAQRQSIVIANDIINACLRYVFFSKDRLTVEADTVNGIYTLQSNGANVKPSDISVGERNILALCYFFVEMLDNLEADKAYSREMLIVIDDPISSFDHENRVGIMSLLRRNIEKVLCGNRNTKVLVMTHDLQATFDFKKIYDEIGDTIKTPKCSSTLYELKDRKLEAFQYRKRHEYSELLKSIFQFGVSADDSMEPVIGNMMRRALEAYATFTYKKDISNISTNSNIMCTLGDKVYIEYFQNLMYRLVLHGESHNEEHVRSLSDDNDFLEMLSVPEKQRTARDIICFIYLLNPQHVLAHIPDSEETIKAWCNAIKTFASGLVIN